MEEDTNPDLAVKEVPLTESKGYRCECTQLETNPTSKLTLCSDLDHPADVQIHACKLFSFAFALLVACSRATFEGGTSLKEAFEQVVVGMFGYMTEVLHTLPCIVSLFNCLYLFSSL